MPNLLKDIYNHDFIHQFGEKIHGVYKPFNADSFVARVMVDEWGDLTLKTRMRKITEVLGEFLPNQYEKSLDILFNIADTCIGFPYLIFPDFVALYGQENKQWELSMKALECFTQKSSSEFAIRPFIIKDPERTMKKMLIWAKSKNEHVRRLSSEGSRPRLPWGESIQLFKKNPAPVISILELLKNDPSLYVRKSVANNLNDISKDNPDEIIKIMKDWKGISKNTDWIIRRGSRTLIKKSDPRVLKFFNYKSITETSPLITNSDLSVIPKKIRIGEKCKIDYNIDVSPETNLHLRIEYGIYFIKKNGSAVRKTFLISDKIIAGGAFISGTRTHSWANLSTRRHYPGNHQIVLIVNGTEVDKITVKLL
jgi:3-methyladenine DNA glycosylase AlkC